MDPRARGLHRRTGVAIAYVTLVAHATVWWWLVTSLA